MDAYCKCKFNSFCAFGVLVFESLEKCSKSFNIITSLRLSLHLNLNRFSPLHFINSYGCSVYTFQRCNCIALKCLYFHFLFQSEKKRKKK